MVGKIKVKIISLVLLLTIVITMVGCTALDPYPDPAYFKDIFPADNNTYNIGSAVLYYHNIYANDGIFNHLYVSQDANINNNLNVTNNSTVSGNITVGGSLVRSDSLGDGGYQHEYSLGVIDLSPGASGATLIAPNASSLGGFQLNAINEYLFFAAHIDHDWDTTSNATLQIYFEVNDDNSGGAVTDVVRFQLETWHKLEGERITTVYSLNGVTVVGTAQQHDLFIQEINVGNLRTEEAIAFRLNLNTITSDVVDAIVNYIEFKYQTHIPAMEVN